MILGISCSTIEYMHKQRQQLVFFCFFFAYPSANQLKIMTVYLLEQPHTQCRFLNLSCSRRELCCLSYRLGWPRQFAYNLWHNTSNLVKACQNIRCLTCFAYFCSLDPIFISGRTLTSFPVASPGPVAVRSSCRVIVWAAIGRLT